MPTKKTPTKKSPDKKSPDKKAAAKKVAAKKVAAKKVAAAASSAAKKSSKIETVPALKMPPVNRNGQKNGAFLTDIKTLRARARQHIMEGAVTEGYALDKKVVVKLLNEALATEIVCVLRYKRHYYMASGFKGSTAATEFLQHANEEQVHADQIALRITQLGGEPNFNPDGLTSRSHAEYVEGDSLEDMIREDLIAERIAIDSYREMIQFVGDKDSTTRTMLEGILAVEEEHANDMLALLENSSG